MRRSRIEVAESMAVVAGAVYFGPTKTYERRTVVLPAFTRDELAGHLTRYGDGDLDGLVFRSPDGTPLRHTNFRRRVWLPAVRSADVPDGLRIHDLRHTCAALLIAEVAHPKAIQEHLGHSSITVTMDTYGHLFPSQMEELAVRLEETRMAARRRLVASGGASTATSVVPLRSDGPEGLE